MREDLGKGKVPRDGGSEMAMGLKIRQKRSSAYPLKNCLSKLYVKRLKPGYSQCENGVAVIQ
jgi:hypothetical protein